MENTHPSLFYFYFFSDKEKCVCLGVFHSDEVTGGCEPPGGTAPAEEGLPLCALAAGWMGTELPSLSAPRQI